LQCSGWGFIFLRGGPIDVDYITVKGRGRAELLIKKSRFLAEVAPASSVADALAFLQQVRNEQAGATHHCYAYKAGVNQRLSDDGEPSGTAGRPIFDVIEKQGLSDLVVVVTRYYGGILLGAGGLVRAYSQAAVAGIEAAGVARALVASEVRFVVDYHQLARVQYLVQQRGALVLDLDFTDTVTVLCRLLAIDLPRLETDLLELTAGSILVEHVRDLQVNLDLQPIHGAP
jgi:uncharacterized YigZ family protein